MAHDRKIERGNALMILTRLSLLKTYMRSVLIGVPVWYMLGIIVTLSPEFAKESGVTAPVAAGTAVSISFIGILIGEYLCGILSQLWQSRRKTIALFLALGLCAIVGFFLLPLTNIVLFYGALCVLGVLAGYWVTLNTTIAEQFGTNLRATAATSIPNIVRGSVILLNMMFAYLHGTLGYSYQQSGLYLGVGVMALALLAVSLTPETFHRDLDFIEH
jgi:MFS family permease